MTASMLNSTTASFMPKVLVTGGAGFIGSHLVDALLRAGHDVRVVDNFSTGERRNLLHVRGEIEIMEGDLRSFERVMAAVRGCELVFHQAALPSVPRSIQDPLTSSEVNVTGTLNVLLAARDAGVRRVVYASSSSVYGAITAKRKREDMRISPLSPYGVTKYAGEAYCSSFMQAYGLETVSLRYFNVFGPRQNPISEYAAVVPAFIAAALMNERPTIYGDGAQSRDFTYVENVVQANLLAARLPEAPGEVFNIGCGESHTVNALLAAVATIAERPLEAAFEPPRVGEVRESTADISKAAATLGYEPAITLSQGLRRTYDGFVADESLIPRIHERRRWLAAS
jgi:UDP-N-acetylglucosamine/UDP-N-acetyl-alpha-D-glucosaminouronate 4-epimerase